MEINDLIKRVDSLESRVNNLERNLRKVIQCRSLSTDFGGPNPHPRKECITKSCTREAPQDPSRYYCGVCTKQRREKYYENKN